MPTAKEYRQHAQECVELANAAADLFAKQSMTELAEEFNKAADELERFHRFRDALTDRRGGTHQQNQTLTGSSHRQRP